MNTKPDDQTYRQLLLPFSHAGFTDASTAGRQIVVHTFDHESTKLIPKFPKLMTHSG